MSKEKRRFSRIFFDVDAKLQIGEETFKVDRIVNLSVGGCLLELTGDFTVDTACTFIISLSHMGPGVEIHSKIVRTTGDSLSLQFVGISPDNLIHLQNIMRYNAENPERIEKEISDRPGLK